MRALFAVLLLLALTVVFLPHPATAATDCQRATCSASFERAISTNAWGVTTLNDYVNLTSNVQVPASETKFVFNVTTVFAGLLSYSPDSHSFTFEANPFPLVDGTYNVTKAKVTLQTGDWLTPRIPLPLNQTITGGNFTCTLP